MLLTFNFGFKHMDKYINGILTKHKRHFIALFPGTDFVEIFTTNDDGCQARDVLTHLNH